MERVELHAIEKQRDVEAHKVGNGPSSRGLRRVVERDTPDETHNDRGRANDECVPSHISKRVQVVFPASKIALMRYNASNGSQHMQQTHGEGQSHRVNGQKYILLASEGTQEQARRNCSV